jgi:hypothetical protein
LVELNPPKHHHDNHSVCHQSNRPSASLTDDKETNREAKISFSRGRLSLSCIPSLLAFNFVRTVHI